MNRTSRPRGVVTRRQFIHCGVASLAMIGLTGCRYRFPVAVYQQQLDDLERSRGGRLGVAFLSLDQDTPIGHRVDERFGLCSTFKLALAAVILKEVEEQRLALDTPVRYTADDLVPYSPTTRRFLDQGVMTVGELAETAQRSSDNTAANLLLGLIGGPAGFTRRLNDLGDDVTRLDRYEPDMNRVPAGEVRDTTTPAAMALTTRQLVLGSYLSNASRAMLQGWMEATTTGRARLRAGFPTTWRSGDKTGTGVAESMASKFNDVAVAWPDEGAAPFVLSVYYESSAAHGVYREEDQRVLRRVAEITADALQ
ncbi:MAG: class A beta-lactamase [Pseudomonadota bacterium]